MFKSVLIANRGEIALRVARTCREMGLRVIAVYSTEDRDSAVVRFADQAVCIGPGPAKLSYLNMAAIVEAAISTGAGAVHPGYGFLSEVPDFAEACESSGLVFVGPPASVMQQLGDKSSARRTMAEVGLPMLPGSIEPIADADQAAKVAADVGYPVIVKAVAGGGGRGMCIVTEAGELPQRYREIRTTAAALFGDDRVYIERYLPASRHIEVQVVCDRHGNGVHLGLRDCSVQRRRQKIIEETPAPNLPAAVADEISQAAVKALLATGYAGAGTVEFLLDGPDRWYFMEVNCRIQVEHPVTELVYGVDLVREQLLIAAGQPLGLKQSDLVPRGAAIECRINAEDPARDFLPTPGQLTTVRLPGGQFVRVDADAHCGGRVSPAYDPLLAKISVWGSDRPQAVARMLRALDEFHVEGPGVSTNRDFLRKAMRHPPFVAGTHNTSLVADLATATS